MQLIPLPDQLDDLTVAAAANPGMSSWVGLTRRARFKRGESVLINGATGSSGRLAIQVAKHLGARRVVATGRKPESEPALRNLGADAYLALEQPREDLVAAFRGELQGQGVDVVLDYLYGASAEAFISACIGPARGAAEPRIRFVQIGAMMAPSITLPAAALRSSGLELVGSGFGAASHQELVTGIAELFEVYADAGFQVEAEAVPLADVSAAFARSGGPRIVLTL
jgi:NADPH:quinone reductase-like Zn-dependent oxidoreductase